MLIARRQLVGHIILLNPALIAQITSFPEHGMGCSLVDVILKDFTLVMQVPVWNGNLVCFYDNMKQFSEAEITSVAPSQV